MSRINYGVEPWRLTDEHLLAEHREIKRICHYYEQWSKKPSEIPKHFCLGTGHVKFFVNKPDITFFRYKLLHEECLKRGFNVQDFSENWKVYKNYKLDINNVPKVNELTIELVKKRIKERLLGSSKVAWHYTKVIPMQPIKHCAIIAETASDLLFVDNLENWN